MFGLVKQSTHQAVLKQLAESRKAHVNDVNEYSVRVSNVEENNRALSATNKELELRVETQLELKLQARKKLDEANTLNNTTYKQLRDAQQEIHKMKASLDKLEANLKRENQKFLQCDSERTTAIEIRDIAINHRKDLLRGIKQTVDDLVGATSPKTKAAIKFLTELHDSYQVSEKTSKVDKPTSVEDEGHPEAEVINEAISEYERRISQEEDEGYKTTAKSEGGVN